MKLLNFTQPIQYTDSEINIQSIEWDNSYYKILLIFPDTYDIGMSHYGYNLVFNLLTRMNKVLVDRAFLPQIDFYNYLIKNRMNLKSFHYKKNFSDFDLIAVTFAFELSYLNFIAMMKLANIPLYSIERNNQYPIIIAGGYAIYNPEILKNIIDIFYIGDSEFLLEKIISDLFENKSSSKNIKLNSLKKYENVFIPDIKEYAVKYTTNKLCTDFVNQPVPLMKTIHNRGVVEIMRGCLRGCRFCQAGYIYRPLTIMSVNDIFEMTKLIYFSTGYEEIGYLSLSSSDYPQLNELIEKLMPFIVENKISISFPSQRIDNLDKELCKFLMQGKRSGLTLAVEAGSQRLRNAINKNITDTEIFSSIKTAVDMGWRKLKLYFMLGLPGETFDDIKELTYLINRIFTEFQSRITNFNISVSTFIPKPHTPFQYLRLSELCELDEKINFIKKNCFHKKISVSYNDPLYSNVEYILSTGNSVVMDNLIKYYETDNSLILQDRSEYFNKKIWQEFVKSNNNFKGNWSNIKLPVSNEFLNDELQKSKAFLITKSCIDGNCNNCGICDCNAATLHKNNSGSYKIKTAENNLILENTVYFCYRIEYMKTEKIKYISVIDLQNLWNRILRKINIPLVFSEGFNKQPKLIFSPAIPVGAASNKEYLDFFTGERIDVLQVKSDINEFTNERIIVKNIFEIKGNKKENNLNLIFNEVHYKIIFNNTVSFNELKSRIEKIFYENKLIVKKIYKGNYIEKEYELSNHIKSYNISIEDSEPVLNLILIMKNGAVLPIIKFLNSLYDFDVIKSICKIDIK